MSRDDDVFFDGGAAFSSLSDDGSVGERSVEGRWC
jgi:hypothetical protein